VISRTSVMRYKNVRRSLPEIAQELNVEAVLEGSVLHAAQHVRVSIQLIRASNDEHIWADNYDAPLSDVIALQKTIAQQVAREVKAKLTPQEQRHLTKVETVDPEAYKDYLRGCYFANKRTPDTLKKAIEFFQRAIGKQPDYASAYAGLAEVYVWLNLMSVLPYSATYPQASTAVRKALELAEGLTEGLLANAFITSVYEAHRPSTTEEFERALASNPGSARVHQMYSIHLVMSGRYSEAEAEFERAIELDPLSPSINADGGWMFYLARKYDRALEELQRTVEMEPLFRYAHYRLGFLYMKRRMFAEAAAEFKGILDHTPDEPGPIAALLHAQALAGNLDEALELFSKLQSLSTVRFVAPSHMAFACVGLKEWNRALEWLEKAYDEHDSMLKPILVDPLCDGLRTEPRFQHVLQRLSLPCLTMRAATG
jgi:tetratricopeptide (TPR) repeat protein